MNATTDKTILKYWHSNGCVEVRQYDVLCVSWDGGKTWDDFATIRETQEAEIAIRYASDRRWETRDMARYQIVRRGADARIIFGG